MLDKDTRDIPVVFLHCFSFSFSLHQAYWVLIGCPIMSHLSYTQKITIILIRAYRLENNLCCALKHNWMEKMWFHAFPKGTEAYESEKEKIINLKKYMWVYACVGVVIIIYAIFRLSVFVCYSAYVPVYESIF